MSALAIAAQAALVAALRASPGLADLTGVYDGPPPRAAFPYVALGDTIEGDWSTKDAVGRELRLAVTIWDDGASATRLHGLIAAAEDAIEAIGQTIDGGRIASLAFLRARVLRDPSGPWAGMIEYRARVMATN